MVIPAGISQACAYRTTTTNKKPQLFSLELIEAYSSTGGSRMELLYKYDIRDEIVSYALDAAACVYELLNFLLVNDHNRIISVAALYTGMAYYEALKERKLTANEIGVHPQSLRQDNSFFRRLNNNY